MGEIIQIQVGAAGNNIGSKFWEEIAAEHGIDPNGNYSGPSAMPSEMAKIFFRETSDAKFVARSVLVDSDCDVIGKIKTGDHRKLFDPNCFVHHESSTRRIYKIGFENNWLKHRAMGTLRRELEKCDRPQGFQVCSSLGGGTGSGMVSNFLKYIKERDNEEIADKMRVHFSVLPSNFVQSTPCDVYNTVLSLMELRESVHASIIFDNQALHNICTRKLNITPSLENINRLIGETMSGVTATFRYPSKLNQNLRKLAVNMVPLPDMRFLSVAHAPLVSSDEVFTIENLTEQVWDPRNMMSDGHPPYGFHTAVSVIYRGTRQATKVDDCMRKIQQQYRVFEWVPDNVRSTICEHPPLHSNISATLIGNRTSIRHMFQRLGNQFGKLYKKRAFTHYYTEAGMQLNDFKEAEESLNELIDVYKRAF